MRSYKRLSIITAGIGVLSVVLAACSGSPAQQLQQPAPAAPALEAPAPGAPTQPRPASAPGAPATAAPAPQASAPGRVFSRSANSSRGQVVGTPAAPTASAPGAPFRAFSADSANQVGGTSNPNDEPYDATFFKHYGVNPFIDTEDDHLSTFAMDVDTASYTVMRRFITDGFLPDPDSVRVEEFVNYFDQQYESPEDGAFAIHLEGSPSPFGSDKHWLMKVGLQGKTIANEDRKDASLIFTIDVSGSMNRENRLGLVKKSLRLLVNELRPTDDISIVVYGSQGRVLLNPTSGEDANREYILNVIDSLQPGGSTNAAEGLTLAYELAAKTVQPGQISRVILLSDGVANVGDTGSDSILKTVRRYVDSGVTLSTVGFGMGNFNDVLMEQLANDGNGNYSYVDTLAEAKRIFVENLTGTLQMIAKDAKVQVDFDPAVVKSYRLLGYENRRVADDDFRNDEIDAGEVGAGHSVTALYELKLHDEAEGRAALVSIRYEDPDSGLVTEISKEFSVDDFERRFDRTSPEFQLSAVVAEYAEILRESYWAQDGSMSDVFEQARNIADLMPQNAEVAEFFNLVARAETIESNQKAN